MLDLDLGNHTLGRHFPRDIDSAGLRPWRPYIRAPFSQRHRQARPAWTRQHCRWTKQQHRRVTVSAGCAFRCHIWHRRGNGYANCATAEHYQYKGGSLLVWGSIDSRTQLVVLNGTLTGQRYMNKVLQPVVLSFIQHHHVMLQDDNTRLHWARIVQQSLQQNNADYLDWPAWSPDFSPIKHVWDILG